MRVGIDASNLREGGGVTHLVELLRAADPRADGFQQVIVWGSGGTLSKIDDRDWLRKIRVEQSDRGLPRRLLWQHFRLKASARRAGCDVLFVPGGSDGSGFRPMVAMSQNLLPFERRETRRFGPSWNFFRISLLRLIQSRTFRRADGLIFLTMHARDVVTEAIGLGCGSVAVIPHGVDERFFRAPREQRAIGEFSAEAPLRLLYVSILDMYKHQWHVAEAAAELRAAGLPVALDFVGPAYPPALKRLNETLRRVDAEGRFIRYTGAVPHEDLPRSYAAADIGVFASSCESLPNILLEGMASGLPIACSDRGPMPEVLGDAGVYFDPERPREIAAAIRRLIDSPELRMEKARAARERAREFSWRRCAAETFAFIAATTGRP